MTALEDFDLDDRARALVSVAAKYDELHTVLTGADRWMNDERAEQALVAMARPFAHPLLDPDTLRDLLRDLRDACTNRSTYESFGFLPDAYDKFVGDTYSRDEAEQMLDDDVDVALWPLLSAQSLSCAECRRIRADVTRWQPVVHGMRCADHALVLVAS